MKPSLTYALVLILLSSSSWGRSESFEPPPRSTSTIVAPPTEAQVKVAKEVQAEVAKTQQEVAIEAVKAQIVEAPIDNKPDRTLQLSLEALDPRKKPEPAKDCPAPDASEVVRAMNNLVKKPSLKNQWILANEIEKYLAKGGPFGCSPDRVNYILNLIDQNIKLTKAENVQNALRQIRPSVVQWAKNEY